MSPQQDKLILMAGPSARGGGMAAVANTLAAEIAKTYPDLGCALIDSGGGRGWRGYHRFFAAMWTTLFSRYDILHVHVASKGSTLRKACLAMLAHLRKKPYLIHLHGGGYVDFFSGSPRVTRWFTIAFFKRAAAIVVLSRYWREFVIRSLQAPPEKVRIIGNGVTSAGRREANQTADSYLVFVGEVSRRKGVDLLLQALGEILVDRTMADWRCVIMGRLVEPAITGQFEALPEHVRQCIEFTGVKSGAEKDAIIRNASIFVLPSRAEALPMSLLEAMSAELACVITRVGSVPEIIVDQVNGLLVPVDDVHALTTALRELMESLPLRERLGHNARALWQRKFTAEVMTQSVVAVWDDVLGDKHDRADFA